MTKRTVSIFLILILLLTLSVSCFAANTPNTPSDQYAESEFYARLQEVQLTGVQRADLVNVALSQVGYHEGELYDYSGTDQTSEGNCTEYNRYYYSWDAAGDNFAWCAVFLSWCARAANISRDIIHNHNRVNAGSFGLIPYSFASRVPICGDVVFVDNNPYPDADHVGIVYRVDDDYIYTVEGNTENAVRLRRYERSTGIYVDDNDITVDTIKIKFFGVAWFSTGSEGEACCYHHLYTKGCEDRCAVCGAKYQRTYYPADLTMAALGSEVTVYSEPYSKPKYRVTEYQDSVQLHINAYTVNATGEKWYRLDDGTYALEDDMCYVYQAEELTPKVTVIEEGPLQYRVRVQSAGEDVKLSFSSDGNEPEIGGCVFQNCVDLVSDEPFAFMVKSFHKGTESETVSFAFEGARIYGPECMTEEVSGMDAFTPKRAYIGLFWDVSVDDWFYSNIKKTYELGLMNGYSVAQFGVEGMVTVGQTIALAARLHRAYNTGNPDFDQENAGWWLDPYISYAMDNGIISQIPEDPNKEISRADFAVILSAALPENELAQIADIPDGAIPDVKGEENYVNCVYALYRAGILRGTGELRFDGERLISRTEAAAIITRLACPELRAG